MASASHSCNEAGMNWEQQAEHPLRHRYGFIIIQRFLELALNDLFGYAL
ncbi:MAG: hypothetical protein PHE15_00625 [Dehalococcoidales bacterium]|nr:hypothetical protein [Dehalococcoidales bacterium]